MRRFLGLALVVIAAVFFVFGGTTGRFPSMLGSILTPSALT